MVLVLGARSASAQVPVPASDSTTIAVPADTAATAAVDSSIAAPPAPKRDSAVVITTRPAPARKGARAPEPPYRIQADRMSGGRGPAGDVLYLEKVTITRSGTRLQSQHGRYERATGMVYMDGDVRLRDSTANVTCDEASFSEHEDRLDLHGHVVVIDRDATLEAPTGWYDRKNGIARLTGGVTGHEKKQRLVADEAFYERDSMMVRARGNVVGYDEENRTQLEARAVDFDRRARIATATGQPLLRAKDDDGNETVMHARLLRVDSERRVAEAMDSVLVERDTLRASARYARFDDGSGRGILVGNPRAWDPETQVTGDTLETIAARRRIERVIVRGHAVIDYTGIHEANRGEKSRLSGSRVDMFVSESRIDSLVATGLARNEYVAVAKAGKTAEQNLAKGDTIIVYFKERKIDRARVQGGASGEYHPPVAVGDTAAARLERVNYDGRHIDFVIPKNRIVLDGGAHLTYRDLELQARRVEFDSEKNTLVAEGKPQLVEKGDEVEGQLMTYDMDHRVGTIYQATTAYEKGLYHGKQIRKATDNELDVLGGAYSTCDLDQPHYHFSARYMKIYLKDKLVAKPVVFYLRNVPILALPFYVFPIKPGRHSGFLFPQFEFGFNTTTGQFVRNAGYYWAPSDYFDFTGAGDYYQGDPSYLLRGEMNYKLLYAFDGHVEGRFGHSDATTFGKPRHDEYTFYGTHQQTLGQRTRINAVGNFVSSKEFNKSAFSGGTAQDRLNRFLTSSVQLSHYADWISLNAVVDRRQDLDADDPLQDPDGQGPAQGPPVGTRALLTSLLVTQPSLSASLPTRALGSYSFLKDSWAGKLLGSTYLSLSGRFLSQHTRLGIVTGEDRFLRPDSTLDSSNVVGVTETARQGAASTFAVSDSRRLLGWINFAPSFFGNAVLFDHDEQGHRLVPAAVWSAASGLSTTLYRTVKTPFAGLALRHVLSPSASVSYSPDFPGLTFVDSLGVRRDRFDTFGDIGVFSGRKSARASFSLDQRLQAKYTRGDKVMRLDNLLTWSTSSSYDFLWRKGDFGHPLGPISTSLRLQPPGYVNADASAQFDAYSQRPLTSFGYNLGSTFNNRGGGKPQAARLATESGAGVTAANAEQQEFRESWSASLAYSYAGGYAGPSWSSRQSLNATIRYQLTENWVFDYQTGYDVTKRHVLLQHFNLTRRIHCWDAMFSRSFTLGGEAEYYFRLGIRDQKEIFYERGTRVQSFGGIQ
jgi:lipopolysaccharide assembly outer membrane protein LptD (OstA)